MGTIEAMRVVIDTNVFVSAMLFGGIPGELIPLWKNGRIKPLASKAIIDEYIKVLAYPKFELSEAEIHYILYSEIANYAIIFIALIQYIPFCYNPYNFAVSINYN